MTAASPRIQVERLRVKLDDVAVLEPGSIERTETGKARRVYDHRE